MTYTQGVDVTSTFIADAPAGVQLAIYVTGTPDIVADAQQLADNPGAVWIDQSPAITAADVRADFLDIEQWAGTDAEAAQWLHDARAARPVPGRTVQRSPGFYRSASGVDGLADVLEAAGITADVPLWEAHWGIGLDAAVAMLDTTYRCFRRVGVQYMNDTRWDWDVWLPSWLAAAQTPGSAPPPADPTEGIMAALPELAQNATGQHVRNVQGLCVSHGHVIAVDGDFGPITRAAVVDVQAAAGIAQDGIVGPHTWAALLDAPQPA